MSQHLKREKDEISKCYQTKLKWQVSRNLDYLKKSASSVDNKALHHLYSERMTIILQFWCEWRHSDEQRICQTIYNRTYELHELTVNWKSYDCSFETTDWFFF